MYRLLIIVSLHLTVFSSYSQLNEEEKNYLKSKPVIKIASEMDWPPFDYVEDNKPLGYTIDYNITKILQKNSRVNPTDDLLFYIQ